MSTIAGSLHARVLFGPRSVLGESEAALSGDLFAEQGLGLHALLASRYRVAITWAEQVVPV